VSDVVALTTRLVAQLRPNVGAALFRLLRRHGLRRSRVPGTTCCGQLAWNTGLAGPARRVPRRCCGLLAATKGPVIVPSGSRATMMHEVGPICS
jgi:L-lactate dehydrogenase complex protein LldE